MAYRVRQRIVALAGLAVMAAAPAAAQLYFRSPDFKGQPVEGDEPTVVIPLAGATQAEKDADLVWTLRAGLNVAALQCEFAPSLMTRMNYNGILTHHGKELNTDYKLLQSYFKRSAKKGTSAAAISSAFDQYSTRTYNSFSTLRAQYGFCQTAATIGEIALMTPKGKLKEVARMHLREFRNSLVPAGDVLAAEGQLTIPPPEVPAYPPKCFNSKGQFKKSCAKL